MEELDRDRLDPFGPATIDDRIEIRGLKRFLDPALGINPLAHLETEPAWHEGGLFLVAKIVEIRPIAAGDLQHVPKSFGRDQRGLDALSLGDRIDDGRAAMHEVVHGRAVELSLTDGVEHPPRQVARRGQRFGDIERTGILVEMDEIGEGSADIGCEPAHYVSLSSMIGSDLFTAPGAGQTGSVPAPVGLQIVSFPEGRREALHLAAKRRHLVQQLLALQTRFLLVLLDLGFVLPLHRAHHNRDEEV